MNRQAKVWVNGSLVGNCPYPFPGISKGNSACAPFEFEVTDVVKPGKDNVVAVRITGGGGGVVAPVMIWSPAPTDVVEN